MFTLDSVVMRIAQSDVPDAFFVSLDLQDAAGNTILDSARHPARRGKEGTLNARTGPLQTLWRSSGGVPIQAHSVLITVESLNEVGPIEIVGLSNGQQVFATTFQNVPDEDPRQKRLTSKETGGMLILLGIAALVVVAVVLSRGKEK